MSWIERIKDQIVIITGDKKEFRPQWLNANKTISYNVASFDFKGVSGTLVKRRRPKGAKYKLEIYFQGDDHLDIAKAFELSAADPRVWTIRHPFYDDLKVHPTDLFFDNSQYNVTKITGNILETIDDTNPQSTIVPEEKIAQDKEDTDIITADAYVNNNPVPEVKDLAQMNDNLDQWEVFTGNIIDDADEAETFRNKIRRAKSDVTNAVGEPLAAIRSMQEVINFPSLVTQSVELRLKTLVNEFTALATSVSVLTRRADKFLFENNAGSMITAIAVTVATPLETDYGNKQNVLDVIEKVLDSYNKYIETLDLLQTDDADELDSYMPDSDSMDAINNLINFTISNLFDIALNSKQERSVVLEEDSDLISVTHRFLSLDAADEKIDEFILNNNIGINEHLLLKKGRILRYYV
ncbi:MAG: hypothetical protein ACUZ8E_15785 [Candidatus Anammoxibacter sp.]